METVNLAILVDNTPGVLTRVSGLIARRDFNIESISAGYTEEESVTRINIEVSVKDDHELDMIVRQLGKLVDVIKIVNLGKVESIIRELVLLKVKANLDNLGKIRNIVDIFRGKIVDISPENVVIELTGDQGKVEAIISMLDEFEIIEIARTGAIALSRGPIPVKKMEQE
ncbi:MAG: acetolactate synthase small subunit [Phascolarctobacterium sp.]|nr:acetolactate synthase small subunit [Phascolarctobacterium sp.]